MQQNQIVPIEQYRLAIASIPHTKRGEVLHQVVPWIYTKEDCYKEIVPQLYKRSKRQAKLGKYKIALFVGIGALPCLAPYVNADLFLIIDKNSFVLDRIKEIIEGIKQSDLPDEYRHLVQSETYFSILDHLGVQAKLYWKLEQESFGSAHFLNSVENYKRTRFTFMTRPILYAHGNMNHRPFMNSLGKILTGSVISYLNLSNLGEWSPAAVTLLPYLPLADDALISWSTTHNNTVRPTARLSQGYPQYAINAVIASRQKIKYIEKIT